MEIKINEESYFTVEEVMKKTGLSENSLKSYKSSRFPEIKEMVVKIGGKTLYSKKAIDFLNNRKTEMGFTEAIELAGIEFPSKKEAAAYFGFPPEDLSRYLRVKKAIEAVEKN
ncbi:DNA-binding protein [Lactococcus allomyrinae]|uniref:DNA-binding protein n=1 Tax=Lactococcus allomyrinae TaxID=2419773 RepID=A0A387B7W2_9LACT|nr:DNA-binding protein [Lactococcus allomyrinae]AYF99772.1 DNA-binding protein [Lactococcus allomyrinae]